jgi:hypothetical protein
MGCVTLSAPTIPKAKTAFCPIGFAGLFSTAAAYSSIASESLVNHNALLYKLRTFSFEYPRILSITSANAAEAGPMVRVINRSRAINRFGIRGSSFIYRAFGFRLPGPDGDNSI